MIKSFQNSPSERDSRALIPRENTERHFGRSLPFSDGMDFPTIRVLGHFPTKNPDHFAPWSLSEGAEDPKQGPRTKEQNDPVFVGITT